MRLKPFRAVWLDEVFAELNAYLKTYFRLYYYLEEFNTQNPKGALQTRNNRDGPCLSINLNRCKAHNINPYIALSLPLKTRLLKPVLLADVGRTTMCIGCTGPLFRKIIGIIFYRLGTALTNRFGNVVWPVNYMLCISRFNKFTRIHDGHPITQPRTTARS